MTIGSRVRLPCDCDAKAEQPRAITRSRLGEGLLTSLTAAAITALDKALRRVMGLA